MTELEQEPAAAARLFGDQIDVARAFTDRLATHGETLGLIGPRECSQLWSRHILNSVLLAPLLEGSVADVGSGAGLPGLVLAIARPDVSLTLIEPMERRCAWLTSTVDALSLGNVSVVRARAEELHGTAEFDQVTARAVSALKTLVPWTAPLVLPGGSLLLLKGARAADEIDAAAKVLRRYRVEATVEELAAEGVEPTRMVRGIVTRPA